MWHPMFFVSIKVATQLREMNVCFHSHTKMLFIMNAPQKMFTCHGAQQVGW